MTASHKHQDKVSSELKFLQIYIVRNLLLKKRGMFLTLETKIPVEQCFNIYACELFQPLKHCTLIKCTSYPEWSHSALRIFLGFPAQRKHHTHASHQATTGMRGTATAINLAHPTEHSPVTRTVGRVSLLYLQCALASLLQGGDEQEKTCYYHFPYHKKKHSKKHSKW